MPRVGIFYLPLAPNTVSPSTKLIDFLSYNHPEQPHNLYTLDHRLFVDTSSQLPNADPKHRIYAQILTTSHNTQSTFVGSSKSASNELSLITIPTLGLEGFTGLIMAKLQPLWLPRQFLHVDNGVSIAFRNGFNICIGDVKVAPRQQGAGAIRGMLVELREDNVDYIDESEYIDDAKAEDRAYLAAVLNDCFQDTDMTFDQSKISVARTRGVQDTNNPRTEVDWSLAKAYMTLLRHPR